MAGKAGNETVGAVRWLITIGAIGLYFVGSKLPPPSVAYEASSLLGPPVRAPEPLAGISVFMLGVTPIISALSFMEIARLAVPPLARWAAKGPRQADIYLRIARALALSVAAIQALGVEAEVKSADVVFDDGWPFPLEIIAAFVGATAVLIWLADLINAKGVGDGLVLLFAAPIAAHLPARVANWRNFGAFLPAYIPISLLALALLSVAALVAVSRRSSRNGALDLWSLLLAVQVFAALGGAVVRPWTLLVAFISSLFGGDLAPKWASALEMGGVVVHVLVAAGLFAIAALRRAYVDQTRLEATAWLLLIVEFVVWSAWWPIAKLTPVTAVYGLGFSAILCVAAALSLLPPWRGGRALAPG
jgi:hypothetical protein